MTTAHGKETGMTILFRLAASASAKSEKGRSQACAIRNTSSINNASMPDLRNVTIASVGAQTIGSLSLKDVDDKRHAGFRKETGYELVKARI